MQYPHCDPRILHDPEDECEVCDQHPEWQELRKMWKINFTGKRVPDFIICPSELERPLDTINAWPNNRPYRPRGEQP